MEDRISLAERKAKLEQRLEDGDRKIEEEALRGRDVTAWEDFWMTLLAEYEDVCEQFNGGR